MEEIVLPAGAESLEEARENWWRKPRAAEEESYAKVVKNDEGKTALMLALEGGHDEIVRLLKQAGAAE
ncbi:MAG TPA: hypothetical protein VF527_19865 [Pyrinomonadaceae bacterium]